MSDYGGDDGGDYEYVNAASRCPLWQLRRITPSLRARVVDDI